MSVPFALLPAEREKKRGKEIPMKMIDKELVE